MLEKIVRKLNRLRGVIVGEIACHLYGCILREQTDIFADSNGHGALSPDKCEAVPSLTA